MISSPTPYTFNKLSKMEFVYYFIYVYAELVSTLVKSLFCSLFGVF